MLCSDYVVFLGFITLWATCEKCGFSSCTLPKGSSVPSLCEIVLESSHLDCRMFLWKNGQIIFYRQEFPNFWKELFMIVVFSLSANPVFLVGVGLLFFFLLGSLISCVLLFKVFVLNLSKKKKNLKIQCVCVFMCIWPLSIITCKNTWDINYYHFLHADFLCAIISKFTFICGWFWCDQFQWG